MEKRRPPAHIREQVDLTARIHRQSVEIVEVRPRWQSPGENTKIPVAKATFVRTQGVWKVYWQRADLKWHAYPFAQSVDSVEEFLEYVAKDEHACFFG